MRIGYSEADDFLRNSDNILILTHQSPDGDCIGSGFALHDILSAIGKKSCVVCSDEFPRKFDFLTSVPNNLDFEPETIVAVDVADTQLLGKYQEIYGDKVQLCIDHHISNTGYAEHTLLEENAAAACEVIYKLAYEMGIELSDHSASCIYTGIATDTGCFKYENTSAETHEIVAKLMRKHNLKYAKINREMFDIKSIGRLKMESVVTEIMEYYLNNKLTMICITGDILKKMDVDSNDLDGCASLPLQVENVEVGVTIKQNTENTYKISMRSANDVNVSAICQTLGGGGHIKAAGCLLEGTLDEVKTVIIETVRKVLEE